MADEEEYNNEQQKPEPDTMNKAAIKRAKQLEKLNEYVKQMAYKPVRPHLATERTESLAQTKKKNIVGTYDEHKDDLKPKGRSERVERIVAKYKTITTEQLEDFIHEHRKRQAKSEEDKKQQQILYHETLSKLQKQCEEQLMNAIVNKFANEVAKRASVLPPSNVETESYQSLQKSLVCNMYLALKVPNDQQSQDYSIYNKLAAVLADLILQALFLAQNADDQAFVGDREPQQKELQENTEKDRCIKLRALRAAKKKLYHRRQRSSKPGCTVFSHIYSG